MMVMTLKDEGILTILHASYNRRRFATVRLRNLATSRIESSLPNNILASGAACRLSLLDTGLLYPHLPAREYVYLGFGYHARTSDAERKYERDLQHFCL